MSAFLNAAVMDVVDADSTSLQFIKFVENCVVCVLLGHRQKKNEKTKCIDLMSPQLGSLLIRFVIFFKSFFFECSPISRGRFCIVAPG